MPTNPVTPQTCRRKCQLEKQSSYAQHNREKERYALCYSESRPDRTICEAVKAFVGIRPGSETPVCSRGHQPEINCPCVIEGRLESDNVQALKRASGQTKVEKYWLSSLSEDHGLCIVGWVSRRQSRSPRPVRKRVLVGTTSSGDTSLPRIGPSSVRSTGLALFEKWRSRESDKSSGVGKSWFVGHYQGSIDSGFWREGHLRKSTAFALFRGFSPERTVPSGQSSLLATKVREIHWLVRRPSFRTINSLSSFRMGAFSRSTMSEPV